mgnify:FL=1|jgi:hypothetical protein
MPYVVDGKCVYKKKADGSKGKKVGCTDGDVNDYLAALHTHANENIIRESDIKLATRELAQIIAEEVDTILREVSPYPPVRDPLEQPPEAPGTPYGGGMVGAGSVTADDLADAIIALLASHPNSSEAVESLLQKMGISQSQDYRGTDIGFVKGEALIYIKTLIKEELSKLLKEQGDPAERELSQQAIGHASSTRDDGLSFEDFSGMIVDKLDLYDEWVAGRSPEEIVEDLKSALRYGMTGEF